MECGCDFQRKHNSDGAKSEEKIAVFVKQRGLAMSSLGYNYSPQAVKDPNQVRPCTDKGSSIALQE